MEAEKLMRIIRDERQMERETALDKIVEFLEKQIEKREKEVEEARKIEKLSILEKALKIQAIKSEINGLMMAKAYIETQYM